MNPNEYDEMYAEDVAELKAVIVGIRMKEDAETSARKFFNRPIRGMR